ncbi:3TM-type holin [Marinobacter subterrani]|uniref:Holin of 3TMs, for gene-transfer release n=1 Tax=Marinobacter subterrani TaxID=1658765 RepID=A0A0J7J641_9GAMM|nr:3TM-type holin [Marinobacter subterrani]KMQ74018.1 hypothetical protein Msub_10189 [Marinobacter subterrani]
MSWSWDDVKGVVAKAAPLLGSALGPAGGAVGTLIASALGTDDNPEAVATAIQADPDALVKLKALEREHERELKRMVIEAETARLAEINQTMRAEASAQDGYVRRWRPTFGYMVAITWLVQSVAIAWAMVGAPENAADLINAVTALTPMWGIALSILGINITARSRDKRASAGQDSRGLLDKLTDSLEAKRHG